MAIERTIPMWKIWCENCEKKTNHTPVMDADGFISGWVCCECENNRREKDKHILNSSEKSVQKLDIPPKYLGKL